MKIFIKYVTIGLQIAIYVTKIIGIWVFEPEMSQNYEKTSNLIQNWRHFT